MKIILHGPEEEAARQELARQAALVHAWTALETFSALICSGEEKARLPEEVPERAGSA